MYVFLFICLMAFNLIFTANDVYAKEGQATASNAATSSNASDMDDDTFLNGFYDFINSLIGGPGNEETFLPDDIERNPMDDKIPIEENGTLSEIFPFIPDEGIATLALAPSDTLFYNMLRFDCNIGNRSVTLLFSPAYADNLFVDSSGNLWNVSTSNIQGLVVDGNFNPYHTEGELVYLTPCLGNNFSTNEQNGSPNYIRRYYWNSSDRLTYTESYVRIEVLDAPFLFKVSDTLNYAIIFLLLGGVLLIWLRSYRHY